MKTRLVKILTLLMISFLFYGCNTITKPSITYKDKKSSNVIVNIELDKNSNTFTNSTLVISVYEYNPLIADVPAKLVEKKEIKVDFIKNKNSSFPIKYLVHDSKISKENRKYYLSVRVYNKDKKQTHYGYKDGTEGFIKISKNLEKINVMLK